MRALTAGEISLRATKLANAASEVLFTKKSVSYSEGRQAIQTFTRAANLEEIAVKMLEKERDYETSTITLGFSMENALSYAQQSPDYENALYELNALAMSNANDMKEKIFKLYSGQIAVHTYNALALWMNAGEFQKGLEFAYPRRNILKCGELRKSLREGMIQAVQRHRMHKPSINTICYKESVRN